MMLIGRWDDLEEMYRRDFEEAVAAGLKQVEARLLMEQGELLGRRNQHDRAEEHLTRAMSLYRELGDDQGWTQCESGLAVIGITMGEYDKAEALITNATNRAREHGHKAALCWLLNSHAVLCKERGQIDRAIEYLKEKMAISLELGTIDEVASSHMNIAVLYTERGQYDLAFEHNETALALCSKTGDIVLQNYTLYNQAQMLRKMKRNAECLEYFQKALDISRHLGDEPTVKLILDEIANANGSNTSDH
jgi:tetratricopeptide (TPR) repeat protein